MSIDRQALTECPDLPQPADGKQSTLFANHVEVTRLYHDCQTDHHGLIEGIRGQRGIELNGSPGPGVIKALSRPREAERNVKTA